MYTMYMLCKLFTYYVYIYILDVLICQLGPSLHNSHRGRKIRLRQTDLTVKTAADSARVASWFSIACLIRSPTYYNVVGTTTIYIY